MHQLTPEKKEVSIATGKSCVEAKKYFCDQKSFFAVNLYSFVIGAKVIVTVFTSRPYKRKQIYARRQKSNLINLFTSKENSPLVNLSFPAKPIVFCNWKQSDVNMFLLVIFVGKI